MVGSAQASILILAPVYNDWTAAELLLEELGLELGRVGIRARVLLVDDGSAEPPPEHWHTVVPQALTEVRVLALRRNVGHQRAIAIGLAYVEEHAPCDVVVVMDSDGEDAASDVPTLVRAVEDQPRRRIAFARRQERSEGRLFRLFYFLYRQLYWILTGRQIRSGNFSALPYELLRRVVAVSEIWIHYASGLQKSRLPFTEVSTKRGRRLAGASRMNFVGLVTHGLSAIAVYADVLGTRLMVATSVFGFITLSLIASVVVIRVATPLAIPGWATTATGLLLLLFAQALMFSLFFAFIVLNARNTNSFIPCRDYVHFVLSCEPIESLPELSVPLIAPTQGAGRMR